MRHSEGSEATEESGVKYTKTKENVITLLPSVLTYGY